MTSNLQIPRPAVGGRIEPLPFPLSAASWQMVVRKLELPRQEARIIGLLLRDMRDKQIACELGLSTATVRTYFARIFRRLDVEDRLGVVLRVFCVTQQTVVDPAVSEAAVVINDDGKAPRGVPIVGSLADDRQSA